MPEGWKRSGTGQPDDGREEGIWRLASALAGAATPAEVARAFAEHTAAAAGASFANMALLDAERARVRAVHDPALDRDVAARWAEFGAEEHTPLTDAMLSVEPVLLGSLDALADRYPHMLDDTVTAGLMATASFPVTRAQGTVMGAVGFGWTEPQDFPPAKMRRLELIAQLTGQALDRAVLFEEERQRTAHLRGVQALTERLAGAVTAEQIAGILAADVAPLLGAAGMTLAKLHEGWVDLFPTPSLPLLATGGRLSLDDPWPVLEAIRTGTPVVLSSAEERARRFPNADWLNDVAHLGALVASPAVVGGRTLGAILALFPAERSVSAAELGLLQTLAGQCAQALERAGLLDAERLAAKGERRNARRLNALQNVTARLAAATTTDEIAHVVVEHGIRMIADHGVIAVSDPMAGSLRTWASDGFPTSVAQRYATLPNDSTVPVAVAARSGASLIYQSREAAVAASPESADTYVATDTRSLLAVPSRADGRVIGALAVGFTEEDAIDDDVVALTTALAGLAGQALHRAALTDRSRRVAETLQRSLLPDLPAIDGIEVAARYVPGGAEVEVGGDWYDLIELADGNAAFVIGDVMGRGIQAAAVMGQLRAAIRAYFELGLKPREVLTHLDRLVGQVGDINFVTCLCAVYSRADGRLTAANAGHFAPLAAKRDSGAPVALDIPPAPPLGSGIAGYVDHEVPVEAGTTLVLFTDGLVEDRHRDLDDGLRALTEHLGDNAHLPLPELVEALLEGMRAHHQHEDDTALLILRASASAGQGPAR